MLSLCSTAVLHNILVCLERRVVLLCVVLQIHGGECPYNEDSLLGTTHPYGLMYCYVVLICSAAVCCFAVLYRCLLYCSSMAGSARTMRTACWPPLTPTA